MTDQEILGTRQLICSTVSKLYFTINECINTLPPEERWLVKSRIINVLFDQHYGVVLRTAEEAIEHEKLKASKEQK